MRLNGFDHQVRCLVDIQSFRKLDSVEKDPAVPVAPQSRTVGWYNRSSLYAPILVVPKVLQRQPFALSLQLRLQPARMCVLLLCKRDSIHTRPVFQRLDRIRGRDVHKRAPKLDRAHDRSVFERISSGGT